MALSKQSAPTRNLVAFTKYAERVGARITEMPPYDRPNPGAHRKGSWHYDTDKHWGIDYGLAADVNFGGAGTSSREREMLTHLVVVAQSMGLACVYALYGTQGSAAGHKTHLHVDVGSLTNLGNGARRPTPGSLVTWDLQDATRANMDNLWGNDTDKRLLAVRAASAYKGVTFPYGEEYTQYVVGTRQDGVWGDKSRAAHDETVKDIQRVLRVKVDGVWGATTEKAWAKARAEYRR